MYIQDRTHSVEITNEMITRYILHEMFYRDLFWNIFVRYDLVDPVYSDLKLYLFNFEAHLAEPWQISFQDPATPVMDLIILFHIEIMGYIFGIIIFILFMLLYIIYTFKVDRVIIKYNQKIITSNVFLELVWTIGPAYCLTLIMAPSFQLLHEIDRAETPDLTVKVIGNQWFWNYDISFFSTFETPDGDCIRTSFDSYMITDDELCPNEKHFDMGSSTCFIFRLLEVDHSLVVPSMADLRIFVTSIDVIHSWAVPSFGVKIDAIPGRLNHTNVFIYAPGIYYGQCSEICGINHSFMPIRVLALFNN